ncbi:hypothetical protein IW140_003517 [Coemansia sp. RSA 1813]|nr:hypothetical protein EV178_003394 [Coemansia sp. RSA 1646]KAJ2214326.1 hypothetical protein EV179_003107 [Coemansia sp. RSA 487]KAJ2568892.1 hypothetical protein IW140_003517 [Coemansia sp. RSA 1813]
MSGAHMTSIPADAAVYYATYNLNGAERSASAENVVSAAVTTATSNAQPFAPHEFFHTQSGQPQQQQQHQQHNHHHHYQHQQPYQSPMVHNPAPQYHQQQQQQQQQHPQSSHAPMAQYQVQHHSMGVIGVGVGDPSSAYQAGALAHYAHPATYYAHHSAATPHSAPAVDPSSAGLSVNSAVDNDYFAMSATSSFHPTTPPTQLHQHLGARVDAAIGGSTTNNDNSVDAGSSDAHADPELNTTTITTVNNRNSENNSNMLFECIMEAPTSPSQKIETSERLTYLNKGQPYGISIVDTSHSCTSYTTVVRIAFHEEAHRKSAFSLWSSWFNQQDNPHITRAVELDKGGSIGVENSDNTHLDRVAFQWHGQRGAKVLIRFNCLSTDFSRLKGVKGFQLRVHIDTYHTQHSNLGLGSSVPPALPVSIDQLPSSVPSQAPAESSALAISPVDHSVTMSHQLPGVMSTPVSPTGHDLFDPQQQQPHPQSAMARFGSVSGQPSVAIVPGKLIERCYTCVKLFRDKGAERKNKDERKQLDNALARRKAKLEQNGMSAAQVQQKLAEFMMGYLPVQPYSRFVEHTLPEDDSDAEEPVMVDAIAAAAAFDASGSAIPPSATGLSSINIGVSGLGLTEFDSSMDSVYTRKRSSDDSNMPPSNKRQHSTQTPGSDVKNAAGAVRSNAIEVLGIDPTYVPRPRKKKAALVAYVRPQGRTVYRAIYLERLAVAELATKLARSLELQTPGDVEMIHRTETGQTVRINDSYVEHMADDQYMDVECTFDEDTGAETIYLHF